jgi:hypothetical protein
VIFAFLSARLRQWFFVVVILPIVGRVLQALGVRVTRRSPRVGGALSTVGDTLRTPRRGRSLLRRRRRL